MEDPLKLSAAFLAGAPADIAVSSHAGELEKLLRDAWETGRGPWQQLPLPADVFVRHLARQMPAGNAGSSLALLLEQLELADLYLACACMQGVPAAVEALEHQYLEKLPSLLSYLRLPTALLDEVCQQVRIHLLVGTTDATGPRLGDYTGRGSLMSWIKVIAARLALKHGSSARETPEEDVIEAIKNLPAPESSMELDLIKRRYRHEFHQAVREAFAAISSNQRHLLQLHFVDGLSMTEMGSLYRVNQSTISRWLRDARHSVYEGTKNLLKERLRISSREFESLLAAIESQLDLSLSELLVEKER
jgi:RNA polymerase sigma-70 factor (ECF subfamily)